MAVSLKDSVCWKDRITKYLACEINGIRNYYNIKDIKEMCFIKDIDMLSKN